MPQTLNRLSNYVDRTIAKPGDSTEDTMRKRTFTLLTSLKCLCCFPWALMYFAFGLSAAAVFPLSFAAIILISILVFLAGKNFTAFVTVPAFFMLLIPVALQWQLGGFAASGAVMLWSVLAPLGVLVFRGVGEAKLWFAAFVLLVFGACALELYPAAAEDRPVWMIGVFFAMNIGAVTAIFFGTIHYFVHQVGKEQATVKEKNAALESTLNHLKEMQHQLILNEKMASLGKLAAGVAHEINNPIGAVRSAADVCGRCLKKVAELVSTRATTKEITDDMQYQKSLQIVEDNSEVIAQATDRIATIVSNLKDFARLDEAEFQDADIHAGLDSTLTLMQHEIGSGIEIVRDYGEIPSIPCYPNQLNQVFMSILSKAVDSVDGSGVITIRTYVVSDQVCVAIRDNGRGIPNQEVGNLFDLDFSTTATRVSMDTSLPSAYNIVKSHEGDLRVASNGMEGTEFTISLPTREPPLEPSFPAGEVHKAAQHELSGGR